MMLHEAVMLEIYRQALNASELASPRCHSRESNNSAIAADIRCPSNDSHCSANENVTPAATPIPTTPPVGLPLPASLAPAAAAALLPPQSAMAAYLNAAAAAAQQNHLLLTNPLAAAASFVQQATQGHSPTDEMKRTPNSSPSIVEAPALDFSNKHNQRGSEDGSNEDEDEAEEDRKRQRAEENELETDENDNTATDDANAPLDLSVNAGRKRQSDDEEMPLPKTPRLRDYKPMQPGAWVPPINPYLAAVAAAQLSPKTDCWANKSSKYMPNEATKALEKMTEMTRLGAATTPNENVRGTTQSAAVTTTTTTSSSSNGRHSAWQSHWLTKGADAVKDVFKCVWCKQSFPTLASLTVHMKETQHCGVNVPAAVAAGAVNSNAGSGGAISANSHHAARHSSRESSANSSGGTGNGGSGSNTSSSSAAGSNSSSSKSDLNLLIKETMPLPRKLVRGQDVWLGKGAEQTRQILKCMWCGQSFRSLAEMTSHMQETQHYTNIISQEQIISWKSSDDKTGSGTNGSSSAAGNAAAREGSINAGGGAGAGTPVNTAVSAVLTCKVCDQAFPTLKELSNHMVKNAHYKEHMIRAAPPNMEAAMNSSSPPTGGAGAGRRGGRQGRGEKRKKSLPVRKLLEMERAQHDFKGSNNSLDSALKPLRDFAASTKITCEKCGDKIETALFVDHIRQCLGGHIPMSPRHNNNNNNILKSSYTEASSRGQTPHSNQSVDGRKTADIDFASSIAGSSRSDILCPLPKEGEKLTSSTPSVLNAIEQLIEKSFDTRVRSGTSSYGAAGGSSKPTTPLGSSILKRLGIDDTADYTKPLMDAQTMNFLRSYSSYSAARDRSASESSSVSERCSSRFDSSVTPERSAELSRQTTPRLLTPEKPLSLKVEPTTEPVTPRIKTEPDADDAHSTVEESKPAPMHKISVKKEFNIPEDNDQQPIQNASNAASPNPSERSTTPKPSTPQREEKLSSAPHAAIGSSLNALSSMFDNLNNRAANNNSSSSILTPETNNNQTSNKKSTANPLAALQKLCETTSETPSTNNRSGSSSTLPSSNGAAAAGSMVAFSWACNDGVMTSPDAAIKCSYCDTPFSTKGAYRHHLSKVHFIKDEASSAERNNLKSPSLIASPKSLTSSSPKRCNSKSPINQRQSVSPAASIQVTPTINPYDESPQSKFLKYTELAKQLSSKNA